MSTIEKTQHGENVVFKVIGTSRKEIMNFVAEVVGGDAKQLVKTYDGETMGAFYSGYEDKNIRIVCTEEQKGYRLEFKKKDMSEIKLDIENMLYKNMAELICEYGEKLNNIDESLEETIEEAFDKKINSNKCWKKLNLPGLWTFKMKPKIKDMLKFFMSLGATAYYEAKNKLGDFEKLMGKTGFIEMVQTIIEKSEYSISFFYNMVKTELDGQFSIFIKKLKAKNEDDFYILEKDKAKDLHLVKVFGNGHYSTALFLCDELTLYVPLDCTLVKFIKNKLDAKDSGYKTLYDPFTQNESKNETQDYLKNKDHNICIELIATIPLEEGIYVSGEFCVDDKYEASKHESYLDGNEDVLIAINPLVGDERSTELIKDTLKYREKETPVFLINTISDSVINLLLNNGFNQTDVKDKLIDVCTTTGNMFAHSCKTWCIDEYGGRFRSLPYYLPCCLDGKKDDIIRRDLGIKNVFYEMFKYPSNHRNAAKSIGDSNRINRKRLEWQVSTPEMMVTGLEEKVREYMNQPNFKNKVAGNGWKNINSNFGKTPSPFEYKLMNIQLKYGRGFTGGMSGFNFMCHDIVDIHLATYLNNFITKSMVDDMLDEIKIDGRCLSDEVASLIGQEKVDEFKEKVWETIVENDYKQFFVKSLLYDRALKEADEECSGIHNKFNCFLKKARNFFDVNQIEQNVKPYTDALELMLRQAVEYTKNRRMDFVTKEDPAHE